MGRDDGAGCRPERARGRQRLVDEDVEGGAGEALLGERGEERRGLDDPGAGDVHQDRALSQTTQRGRVDEAEGLGRSGQADDERVAPLEKIGQSVARDDALDVR